MPVYDRTLLPVIFVVALVSVFRIWQGHSGAFEIFLVVMFCADGIFLIKYRRRLYFFIAKRSAIGMARLIMRVCNLKTCSEPPTAVESLTTTVVSTIILSGLAITVHIKQADPSWYGVLAVSALTINVVAWVVDWTAFSRRDDGV
ncbi:hypothetical protein IB237_24675 [Agrobacterium sp. AGB01]|uniref:hypothetical protein n=1 Tax=Agrobacterium sp. AGB01 TaxID=2769302 RepID=UPI0017813F8F|nr:hypothetical protein [Agrobacterium sp. AGB01]MBD9390403.1 hypothetical protein [Agrobacterium sp. AGB01]